MRVPAKLAPSRTSGLAFAGLFIAFALQLLVVVLAKRTSDVQLQTIGWVDHTHEVIQALDRVQLLIERARVARRGFALTANEQELAPYHRAQGELDRARKELETLTAGDDEAAETAARLDAILGQMMANLADRIETRREEGFDLAREAAETEESQAEQDEMRNLAAELTQTYEGLLAQRRAASDESSSAVRSTMYAGHALSLGVLIAAFALLWRELATRRRLESELRASEGQIRRLLEAAPDAMIVADTGGQIVLVNDEASRLFGYSREELIGAPVELLVPERVRGAHAAHRHGYHQAPAARPMGAGHQLHGQKRDGTEFPADISLSPLETPAGLLAISAVRDVTARERARAELTSAKELAETASRELEAFSYSVAHDLRAPLRSIDGFSQAILEDHGAGLPAEARGHLERVRAAAQRMAELIDDLLSLARVTRSQLRSEKVDLSKIAGEIVERLQHAEPQRRVEVHLAPELVAWGDAQLLRIVLENLLANAWKFTRNAANPRIELARDPRDPRIFLVRDNGAGFDMAFVDQLFNPFKRLHKLSEFEGSGIGLATVQRIIQRHGGKIWAEGRVGEGATFRFTVERSER